MSRKLASIQKITALTPINNADFIEVADVLGWKVVVKKGEFNIGDKVVYVEIDSILPEKPEFEFMRVRNFKVKTIKLKKQISQGICFPLSILPKDNYNFGDDITQILGITKIEDEQICDDNTPKNKLYKYLMKYKWFRKLATKQNKFEFPSFIKKTDETRIQNLPELFENEKNNKTVFQVCEKLDGTSATYYLRKTNKKFFFFGKKYEFGVCSRNVYKKIEDDSVYWKIARMYNIERVLRSLISDADKIVLQGEIIGVNIQGNKYNLKGIEFYAFNLIVDSVHFQDNRNACYVLNRYNINFVPMLSNTYTLPDTIDELVNYSKGNSNLYGLREGLVLRNYDKGISFKVINPDFLLKHDN